MLPHRSQYQLRINSTPRLDSCFKLHSIVENNDGTLFFLLYTFLVAVPFALWFERWWERRKR